MPENAVLYLSLRALNFYFTAAFGEGRKKEERKGQSQGRKEGRKRGRKEEGGREGGAGAHSIQMKTGLLTEMCLQRALIEIHSCQETLPSIFKANTLCTWCYQEKGRHEGCIISGE